MAGTRTKPAAPGRTTNKKGDVRNRKQGSEDTSNPDGDIQTRLQRENDKLRAMMQLLEAETDQFKTSLEKDNEVLRAKIADLQKSNQPQSAVPVIPKPKGSSYSLQKKMGLEDDPMKYDEIRTVWKKLIRVAAFEDGVTFTNQPKEKIVKFAKKARVTVPFLRRFKADWPTEAYLRRSLRNRKGHLKRKADKRKAAGIDIDITLGDLSLEDGEGGSSGEMGDD